MGGGGRGGEGRGGEGEGGGGGLTTECGVPQGGGMAHQYLLSQLFLVLAHILHKAGRRSITLQAAACVCVCMFVCVCVREREREGVWADIFLLCY